jgi:glycosyltransferase involved in cell wall biosynthesis
MEMSLKILHVISNLSAGGAEKMVVTCANLFADRGHDVGVALLVEKGPLADQLDTRVRLHLLNRKSRFDWNSLISLAKLANTYDLIHVHLKHNLKFVFVANLVHRIKVPIILHDHSAEVLISGVQKTNLPFFILWWLRKQTYIGVSKALVGWAIENFKLRPARCFTLPNAIAYTANRDVINKEETDLLHLVLVSNFRRIKNLEFGVKLVDELVREGVDVKLDIFGQPLDKKYFIEIKDLIIELNLVDRIRIHLNVFDVKPYLKQYNFAIHCSKAETGPLVLLEYLCVGLPFLTTNNGEVANRVFDRMPELVMDSYEIEKWVKRINLISTFGKEYCSGLITFFIETFSIEMYYNQLQSIYKKVNSQHLNK